MGFCLNKELEGIVDKLTSIEKIGFFFGAGTSMALGMPGIIKLTSDVLLKVGYKDKISEISKQIKTEKIKNGQNPDNVVITIEDILNKIRIIRELTNDVSEYSYCGISGDEAKQLDIDICKEIYQILFEKQNSVDDKILIPLKFASWLNGVQTNCPKEIFTANYDLILEMAMEKLYIPFFDGFVGAYKPFFFQESVESTDSNQVVPSNWIRLWKIHGSLGWFWEKEEHGYRIIRLSDMKIEDLENELVIYPSKEKYHASRKQPFISYFDRMKRFLNQSEGIFIISGYSFGDEHINDAIYESLTRNSRMHIMAFMYTDDSLDAIIDKAILYPNLSVFSPTKAIIGGKSDVWLFDLKKIEDNGFKAYVEDDNLKLGDFELLVDFLIENSGRKRDIITNVGDVND
ncbi:MAG: SIR2 family protein [Firmicutes bacterium HGW-Firmicutes-2]|jgi:hypothetical protein|nr:MAG: SIR2 family protein [Firmicutes bacterium HGW-Firmicutes-2]